MIPVLLAVAVIAFGGPPVPPPPDPHPSSCQYGWCRVLTWGPTDYNVPAVNATTGEEISGLYFSCHVPTRWKGKRNVWGHAVCVPKHGTMP